MSKVDTLSALQPVFYIWVLYDDSGAEPEETNKAIQKFRATKEVKRHPPGSLRPRIRDMGVHVVHVEVGRDLLFQLSRNFANVTKAR